MAREVTEIYNDIIESKNSRSDLSDLNSNSNVAIYKLWAFICAVAIFSHEVLWDLLQVNIDNTLDSRINGTSEWYSLKALEYQDGDELKRLNNGLSLGYDPVNPQNRVVTRAAYSDNNGVLDLKLATGEPESLSKLDPVVELRVVEYFEKIKFAGTQINIISIRPDEIVLDDVTVYHDGTRSDDDIATDVSNAIDDYLVNLPFDGVFYIQSFIDAIQVVNNVVDVYVAQIFRDSYLSDENIPVREIVQRKTELDAGYAIIEDISKLKVEIES